MVGCWFGGWSLRLGVGSYGVGAGRFDVRVRGWGWWVGVRGWR